MCVPVYRTTTLAHSAFYYVLRKALFWNLITCLLSIFTCRIAFCSFVLLLFSYSLFLPLFTRTLLWPVPPLVDGGGPPGGHPKLEIMTNSLIEIEGIKFTTSKRASSMCQPPFWHLSFSDES